MALTSCSRIHLIHKSKISKRKDITDFWTSFCMAEKMWNMPISNTYCERETSITWPIIDRFPFISFYLEFGNSVTLFINTKKLSWDLPNIHNRFIQYIKRKPSKEGNFADSFVSNKLSKELFHWQMFLLDSTKNYFLVLKDTLQNIKCNRRKICCWFRSVCLFIAKY